MVRSLYGHKAMNGDDLCETIGNNTQVDIDLAITITIAITRLQAEEYVIIVFTWIMISKSNIKPDQLSFG